MESISTLSLIMKKIVVFFFLSSPLFIQSGFSQDCNFTIEMMDSFGDGWNGSNIVVYVNCDSVHTFTFEDGNDSTAVFTVNTNDLVNFEYNPGNFEGEVTYDILDNDGAIIFSDGTNPLTGDVFLTYGCATCDGPTNIAVDSNSVFNPTISWSPAVASGTYVIEYGLVGFLGNEATVATTNDTSFTISGLAEDTQYEYHVFHVCTAGDTTIATCGTNTFTTGWLNDVGITATVNPVTACELGMDTIEVTITNFGFNPQTLIPFRYSVNGIPAAIPDPQDGLFTNIISKDSSHTIQFETTYDFSAAGEYVIAAWTELGTDINLENDTTYYTFYSVPTISSYPYFTDLESDRGGWTVGPNSENSTLEYGTPDATTINSAFSGINSWVTNLTGDYNNGELSYLYSPCLDFSSLSDDPLIKMSIFYDFNTFDDDGAYLESSTDGGETWTLVGDLASGSGTNWYNTDVFNNGGSWSEDSNGWVYAEHPLNGLAGEADCRLRFVVETTNFFTAEGFAIDNISIANPFDNDLVTTAVSHSSTAICGSEMDSVRMTIYNSGLQSQTAFDVAYQVGDDPIVIENVGSLSIAPGASADYTFMTPFNSRSFDTRFDVSAWTQLAGEEFVFNDSLAFIFSTVMPVPLPLVADFEDFQLPDGWSTDGIINQAHTSPTVAIYANLYNNNPTFEVLSTQMGPLNANDSLTFDYRFVDWSTGENATTLDDDKLEVLISTDCGDTFTTILTIDNSNHITSTDMRNMKVDLSPYADQIIQLRFLGTWSSVNGNDYFLDLDNINILGCPENLDLSFETTPESSNDAGDGTITVLHNGGLGPYTYTWETGEETSTIEGVTMGNYIVTVTDAIGCEDMATLEFDFVSSTNEAEELINNISLAPNPTKDRTMLNLEFQRALDVNIKLINLMGQTLFEQKANNIIEQQYELDLSNYANGIYFVSIQFNNQQVIKKLIRTQ